MADPVPHLMVHDEEVLRTYLSHCLPFFIEGGPGIGKSLAAAHLGRSVYRALHCRAAVHGTPECICEPLKIDITEDTEVRHLLGEVDFIRYFQDARVGVATGDLATHFRKGPLVRAMEEGRLLVIEELDRAGRDTLFPALFDTIERRRTYLPDLGTTVVAHPTFNIAITVNRSTDVGTVRLPTALLRRLRRVGLYDPSRVRTENGDEDGSTARRAVDFEERIVWSNLVVGGIGAARDAERVRVRQLVDLVVALRCGLRERGDLASLEDHITPAEASRFVCDLAMCDAEATFGAEVDALLAAIRKHVGALAKSEVSARAIDELVTLAYVRGQPPFIQGDA